MSVPDGDRDIAEKVLAEIGENRQKELEQQDRRRKHRLAIYRRWVQHSDALEPEAPAAGAQEELRKESHSVPL